MIDADRDTFALHGQPAIQLDSDGLRHPQSGRGDVQIFTRYEELTHLAASRGGLLLGTRRSAFSIARRRFVDPEGPEALLRALLARLARREGGSEQIRRMAEIERAGREPRPVRATWVLTALCGAVLALQLALGGDVVRAGEAHLALVRDGDLWRLVTGNLLHMLEFPPHFALNMLALASIGSLVERCLGSARSVCIMAVSGVASMLAGIQGGSHIVIGASGVVFGLLGAVLWLELYRSDELPAWLRIPRRSIFWLLLVNAAVMLLPFISGAAHLGGLAAGFATTAGLCHGAPVLRAEAPLWVRSLAHSLALVCATALAIAGWDLFGRADLALRYTQRIASLPGVGAPVLHLRAAEVLADPGASRSELLAALLAEERAVRATSRKQPELLDALAELQFRLGRTELALAAIDEAIALAPADPRFRARRERILLGELEGRALEGELPPWLPDPRDAAPPESVEI